jgi:hypothetical protein
VRIWQEAGKKSAKRTVELPLVQTRQTRRNGQNRCRASKQNVAGLWNNFDFELSQKVNAQNGACHSGLQKTRSKKFALELNSSLGESSRGDRLSICSFEKRARWAGVRCARDNAQSCSSVHQESVISQFICKENQSSIGWEMHRRGSGVCWNGHQTRKGSAAL